MSCRCTLAHHLLSLIIHLSHLRYQPLTTDSIRWLRLRWNTTVVTLHCWVEGPIYRHVPPEHWHLVWTFITPSNASFLIPLLHPLSTLDCNLFMQPWPCIMCVLIAEETHCAWIFATWTVINRDYLLVLYFFFFFFFFQSWFGFITNSELSCHSYLLQPQAVFLAVPLCYGSFYPSFIILIFLDQTRLYYWTSNNIYLH